MRILIAVVIAVLSAGCAGTYKPPTDGPTIKLTVEPDMKEGIPLISNNFLDLSVSQLGPEKYPGTDMLKSTYLGWLDVPAEGNAAAPFVLPAEGLLELTLNYSSNQLFGPTLSGSQTHVLVPEDGASYVMKFWTDKKHFSVHILRKDLSGELVPAQTKIVEQPDLFKAAR